MSILSKLTLTATSPREPITPLARKRIKLLQKLEQQIETAEAEARDEVFMEEIKHWVRNEETGAKSLITQTIARSKMVVAKPTWRMDDFAA
ncbi:MAG: hypothetical protein AB8B94_21055 [Hyphomicrobiales bacterium]